MTKLDHELDQTREVDPVVEPTEPAAETEVPVVDSEQVEVTDTVVTKVDDDEVTVVEESVTVKSTPSIIEGVTEADFQELTNKNQQFMVGLSKQLEGELDAPARTAIYQEIVQTLLDGQVTGQTARQLYGTPSETVQVILKQEYAETEPVRSPDWQIALDGGLLIGSLFTLVVGFATLRGSQTAQSSMGLVSLIVNYLVGGLITLWIANSMPQPDAPKGQRGILKYFLVSFGGMGLWFFSITLSQAFLPPIINPPLPGMAYIVIAAITLLLKIFLKRRWKIVGGLF